MDEKIEIRNMSGQNVEVILPNQIGYERIAMACSAALARMAGFISERIEDLKSAVAEACVNAMEHGNKGKLEARVVVNMSFVDDTFTVSVIDEGQGMPEIPEYPGIVRIIEEDQPTRGLGTFLIQQLVDHVKFNQITLDGHMVTMKIKLDNETENQAGLT